MCNLYFKKNLPVLAPSIFDKHIDGIKYPVFLAFWELFSLELSLKRFKKRIKSNGIIRFYTLPLIFECLNDITFLYISPLVTCLETVDAFDRGSECSKFTSITTSLALALKKPFFHESILARSKALYEKHQWIMN